MGSNNRETGRSITLITLIIATEVIFFLPFVLARIFRPTLLALFDISNTELGVWFSIYGIVAMISYFFGGMLADRISARKLMAIALWVTSGGGFVMATLPSSRVMIWLYAFWGFTTIYLFWAAMIRATREWGGIRFQGRAFGWLEGGRGTVAALLGTLALIIFSRIGSFQWVVLATSTLTLLSGWMVWFFVPDGIAGFTGNQSAETLKSVLRLLKMPSIWLLGVIIICAYTGYKITDDFSLFAHEVLGFSEVSAAGVGTAALWLRALVAIGVGYLADRYNKVSVISVCFGLTLVGGLVIGLDMVQGITGFVLLNLPLTAAGIYGVRTLYFAVLKEAGIPGALTGTAVGIVSFAGFTPEIFIGPWMGHLLDKSPGAPGHHHVFLLLSLFAFIGFVASLFFRKLTKEDV